MNRLTTLKRISRHVWKHECGKDYTRKEINQLKEIQPREKFCRQCSVPFDFEVEAEPSRPRKGKKKFGLEDNLIKMKNRVQKGSSEEILVKKTKKLSKKFNQMIKKAKKKGLEIKSQKPNEVNRKNKKYLKTARQTSNKIERKK